MKMHVTISGAKLGDLQLRFYEDGRDIGVAIATAASHGELASGFRKAGWSVLNLAGGESLSDKDLEELAV